MSCQRCNSDSIVNVNGKCSDLCHWTYKDQEFDGYATMPVIGHGDYIKIKYCLDCGQIQGNFPVDEEPIPK